MVLSSENQKNMSQKEKKTANNVDENDIYRVCQYHPGHPVYYLLFTAEGDFGH